MKHDAEAILGLLGDLYRQIDDEQKKSQYLNDALQKAIPVLQREKARAEEDQARNKEKQEQRLHEQGEADRSGSASEEPQLPRVPEYDPLPPETN